MNPHTPHSPRRATARRRSPGFTIVELLTSVFIISIMMLIIFPVIGAMRNGSRIEAGLNTVSMSVDVTRAWATASLPQPDLSSDPANPVFGASYSGTAVIFCPTGEIRIVINDQRARDTSNNFLEEFSPSLNGYRDYNFNNGGKRDLDYIAIPHGTGVAGIYRDNGGVYLLAPPFAIAFDRNGAMVPGANIGGGTRAIFYDGNFVNGYELTKDRASIPTPFYNPGNWDHDLAPVDGTALVRHLPFEVIETVVGVVIYDETEAEAAGFDFSGGGVYAGPNGGSADDGYNWLRNNGTVVFFSPNTGVAMRDEGNE